MKNCNDIDQSCKVQCYATKDSYKYKGTKVNKKNDRLFEVKGGLGRLCQFPKTVQVKAKDHESAHWRAMGVIRELITEHDFKGNKDAPMLSKVINTNSIKEI